ncbi:MAG: hypothetical protein L6R28_18740, partial [Planctomycetes bacterium]|nr:hypothetical protein [Planctomycetota bacterium]
APAPARPSARAARAGRSARGDRGAGGSGSRRGVGGRGTNLGRRQQARASARGAGGAGGSSARRAAAPAAPAAKPESRRGAKEVFYKSGAKAAAINAVDVADQGGNAVESNVLDAVRANQARKAAGASSGGTRRSQRASARGGRASSRTSGRGGEEGGRGSVRGRAPTGGNNQTIIIGSIAGVIVLIGLVLMLSSGSTKGGNRSSGSEGHVSAGTYASQAKEKERAGDRIAAYELYLKAAESAEAAGRDEEARSYSMRAYAMQKHSTLQMGK